MKHTQEPWHVLDDGDFVAIENANSAICNMAGDFTSNSAGHNKAMIDAGRIVACVNACAGISTEAIETLAVKPSLTAMVDEYKQQRDELLVALKATRQTLHRENEMEGGSSIVDTIWHTSSETLFDFLDVAIAKAEQS